MKNVMTGQAAAATAAPTLSAHRRAIMDMLVGHPLITTAEYDRAMHRTLACQDVATLQKWYRNTVRELARREEAAGMAQPTAPVATPAPAPVVYATAEQVSELHRLMQHENVSKAERTKLLRRLPTLTQDVAAAYIRGLKLRRGPRLRLSVEVAGQVVSIAVAERHYEAARVEYVLEVGTDRVMPRYESLCGGPVVRRVWAN